MKNFPRRGEIFWVNLDPTIGTEAKKIRPGLVLSNDIGNECSSRVIIAPITSSINTVYPFEAKIVIHKKENKVMLDQIRTVDKARIGNLISNITDTELKKVEKALKLVLDIA